MLITPTLCVGQEITEDNEKQLRGEAALMLDNFADLLRKASAGRRASQTIENVVHGIGDLFEEGLRSTTEPTFLEATSNKSVEIYIRSLIDENLFFTFSEPRSFLFCSHDDGYSFLQFDCNVQCSDGREEAKRFQIAMDIDESYHLTKIIHFRNTKSSKFESCNELVTDFETPSDLKNTIAKLRKQIAQINGENTGLRNDINLLNTDLIGLQSLRIENDLANSKLAVSETTNITLQSRIDELENEIEKLKKRIAYLESTEKAKETLIIKRCNELVEKGVNIIDEQIYVSDGGTTIFRKRAAERNKSELETIFEAAYKTSRDNYEFLEECDRCLFSDTESLCKFYRLIKMNILEVDATMADWARDRLMSRACKYDPNCARIARIEAFNIAVDDAKKTSNGTNKPSAKASKDFQLNRYDKAFKVFYERRNELSDPKEIIQFASILLWNKGNYLRRYQDPRIKSIYDTAYVSLDRDRIEFAATMLYNIVDDESVKRKHKKRALLLLKKFYSEFNAKLEEDLVKTGVN